MDAKQTTARGVRYEATPWNDLYMGTRLALIASKIAKEEWFPANVQRDKRGRVKRTFKFSIGNQRASLRDHGHEWFLYLPIPPQEAEKRLAKHQREREREYQKESEQKSADQDKHIAVLLRSLPAFDGELQPEEIEHLRVLRLVSDSSWRLILATAKIYLAHDAKAGELVQDLRPGLQLVVDNTQRAQP